MTSDKGESTSTKSNSNDATVEIAHISQVTFFHQAIKAYWLGHPERCQHYIGKALQINPAPQFLQMYEIYFIHGLNSFQVLKRQNTAKLRSIPKIAISILRNATSNSRWNFRNKVIFFVSYDSLYINENLNRNICFDTNS